jgi:membrane protein implicated in regulation of membrane protease activity
MIFVLFIPGVLAKTVVEAGDNITVVVDEEVEFRGKGEGTYSWDFDESEDENNDGDYTNDAEKTGNTVTHKFTKTGTYKVTLTVNLDGNITKEQSKITVEEADIFDPWIIGLIFVIIGIVMLLAEASSPGFFIGIPACILIVIGLIGIALPALFFTIWSPIIAAIVAVVTTFAVITFYKKLAPPEAPTTTVGESLVGKEGMVMTATDPHSTTKGKVKIGSEIWSATSEKPIKKGLRVVVTASEGVHITVERLKK